MLPLKFVKEKKTLVKENMKKKFRKDLHIVDEAIKLGDERKKIQYNIEQLRSKRNKLSMEINKAKKEKKDFKKLIKEAKEIPDRIKKYEEKRNKLTITLKELLLKIPNIMHKSVPIGKDETKNKTLKKVGSVKKKDFKIMNHAELIEKLGKGDFDTSADISGKGFYILKDDVALLSQAMIKYAIDKMIKKGYEYIEPPLMVRRNIIDGVMTFEEKDVMIYKIEGEDLYLIGTSEHALIGMFVNKTIPEDKLPIKLTAYSMCFRKEIGSHGIDEKGLWRTHQFNKVEQIIICKPEDSWKYFDELLKNSEEIMREIGIPYRLLEMCSGDLGDLKARMIDVEAWLPRKKDYGEIMSCSNLTDNQAILLNIKIADKHGNKRYAHTLNNTALATSRMLVAILENNQRKDGSVEIPKVLRPYMHGKKIIS
jgi:seryl-tRNA synthetase